ncbi:tRNA(adenine34) deaminase [Paramicrobacterium humi]|uniref:tRNA-specific adenosine deaminase n=1 Tax=Paramicrobacterium humi TaxID=640635 RepID=A0A1H4JCB5_9MICO|nr:tRNA adenosine(34) deaminase TadA [Microbacterium humi]SEB43841.1 tRNA(adenine34) deaminase [Microbacterium humi]
MPLPAADRHHSAMTLALAEARAALQTGDVPVGAVIVDAAGEVVAHGRNAREARSDPTAHAELEAIRQATASRGQWRLDDVTLVVTLEPCVMCAGAILAARIPTVVFGAWDDKAGAAGSIHDLLRDRRLTHRVEVIAGVDAEACGQLLTGFFRER